VNPLALGVALLLALLALAGIALLLRWTTCWTTH